MTLLRLLLRESRGTLGLSIVAGAIGGATGVALIALIQAELARTSAPPWTLGLAFAVLCILSAATRVVAQSALVRLGQESVSKLCVFLSRKILALPLEAFEEANPSGLIAVLTEDIVLVANALVGIPLIAINLPLVAACLAYVGWLSPPLLVSGALFAALAIAIYLALGARAMRHLQAARGKKDLLVSHLRSMIEGFRELKLHRGRREGFVREAIEPSSRAVQRETSAGLALYAAAEGWSQMAFFGFVGYLLFVAPTVVDVNRPTLAGVVLVVLYIMSPLDVILTWLPILGRAQASIDKIHKLLPDLEARGSDPPAGPSLGPVVDSLSLEGVTYSYRAGPDEEAFVLGPVDLTLHPGEVVFLVGGNGSGKTTLVKLLAGLYPPTRGQIRVDDVPVEDEFRESYRQLFSVVFADGYLFQDLLGLDDPGLADRATEGLARLELAGRVTFEGRSFSTTDLSQGQRRRLALLTACLEDRPVCVFDEWAANQDPHFKGVFYRQILPDLRAQGKAILVISHDEEYYPLADRVVRLQDGRIVAGDLAPVGNGTA